jgi:hypothetical protein
LIVLSELEQRILSELEEAWAEEVDTIINTVTKRTGDITEVDEMRQALVHLVQAGFIRIAVDRDASRKLRSLSKEESLAVIDTLPSEFQFRGSDNHWAWKKFRLPLKPYEVQIPVIVATGPG